MKNFILHPSSFILPAALLAALAGCGSVPSRDGPPPPEASKSPPAVAAKRPGGYYLDDGPGDRPPANLEAVPEPTPRFEPLHRAAMRPYVALGRSYTPMTALGPYKARGLATWYGRRYHGKPTANGEPYDMYAMTAAHPTLPLPSYVRVTHLGTGRSIVVRVNDRGPFHEGRIIDLSYTAAHRLGILGGATMVEVESIIPGSDGAVVAAAKPAPPSNAGLSVLSPAPAEPLPAAVAAPPAQVPVTTEGGRVFLQLGAFGSRENAETYLARLKSQADGLALQVHARDGLFRVQAGPYAGQSEAREAAERLSQALGIKAMVLTR